MTGRVPAIPRRFSTSTLPWIVAATAVVVYSLTLNPWVSFSNAQQVARVSGWLWEPDLNSPLYFLVTLPIRMLPGAWIPAALNLFNALCAAAVLGLLARSVAILPHDRTHSQRIRAGMEGAPLGFRTAWLAPAFAAIVCGLQLTFWENATAGTTEMLDLLLFAYVIRCLLEFRLSGKAGWLYQTAFLCGMGMSGNYAIIGFLPVYLVALVCLKRLRFFEPGFLLKMFVLGLLGCSLYLLMPLLQLSNPDVQVTFWQSLEYMLRTQKTVLLGFPLKTLLLLSLTSLAPVILISIRWPESFGDINPRGARFAEFLFHIVHAVFLITCIWIALDPPVSPRHKGLGLPFLTFYYLGTIAIGYFVAYFLLLFGKNMPQGTYTFGRNRVSPSNGVVVGAVWILCIVSTAGLVLRNLPQIRLTNSTMLRDYAFLITDKIPEGDAVLLSDDALREYVLRSALVFRDNRPDVILLNTHQLSWPQYHKKMAGLYPDRWPVPAPTNMQARLPDQYLVNLMLRFAASNQVCYAHPSFGYYFEYFEETPAGILNVLTPYQQGDLLPQALSEQTAATNEFFWDKTAMRLMDTLKSVRVRETSRRSKTAGDAVLEWLKLEKENNPTMDIMGRWLSRSLNSYGVALQRSGYLQQAGIRFAQAKLFNPDNIAAEINAEFNEHLQSGAPSSVKVSKSLEDRIKRYRGWERFINANGLFDEPRFCMTIAGVFLQGRLFRQALIEFDRARELQPNAISAQLAYARLVTMMGKPDEALEIVQMLLNDSGEFSQNPTNSFQISLVEASAYLKKDEPETASQLVNNAISRVASDTNLFNLGLQFCIRAGLFKNSLELIDRQLAIDPDNVNLLVNKGFVLLQLDDKTNSLRTLSRALELDDANRSARLNRAIVNLKLGNLDESESDYETLLLSFPDAYPLYYGLGEIAWQRQDTNQAIYNFRLYLSNAPPNTLEAQRVREKLEKLSGTTQ